MHQEATWAEAGRCMALTWHRPLLCYRSVRPTWNRMDLKSLLWPGMGPSLPLAIELSEWQTPLMHSSVSWGHEMALGLLAWTCVC